MFIYLIFNIFCCHSEACISSFFLPRRGTPRLYTLTFNSQFSTFNSLKERRPRGTDGEPRLLVVLRTEQADASFRFEDDFGDRTVVDAAGDAVPLAPRIGGGIGDRHVGVIVLVTDEKVEILPQCLGGAFQVMEDVVARLDACAPSGLPNQRVGIGRLRAVDL